MVRDAVRAGLRDGLDVREHEAVEATDAAIGVEVTDRVEELVLDRLPRFQLESVDELAVELEVELHRLATREVLVGRLRVLLRVVFGLGRAAEREA